MSAVTITITKAELAQLIESAVENALDRRFGVSDSEGVLHHEVGNDLRRISRERKNGKKGTSLNLALQELGLDR